MDDLSSRPLVFARPVVVVICFVMQKFSAALLPCGMMLNFAGDEKFFARMALENVQPPAQLDLPRSTKLFPRAILP